MSWLGLSHKGTEPLYSDEWNRVVDALDILYGYVSNINVELSGLEEKIDRYYGALFEEVKRPSSIDVLVKSVGVTPVPLSDVDRIVKRIHVKSPSWNLYLSYIGDSASQDFVVEPGDAHTLEIKNPKTVYVRSLGDVTIYVLLEY